MNLPLKIARRYFFSRKVSGVVHVISGISVLGVVVGTAALIIILSVFNGFEKLVVSLYNDFDPDIKVLPISGKHFVENRAAIDRLANINGVWAASPVIEENVLARYDDNQTFARIKGVEPAFLHTVGIDSAVFIGESVIQEGSFAYALVGMGVSGKLGINVYNDLRYLQLFIPKGDKKVIINPNRAFNKASIRPSGIFSLQREFDDKYIITPIGFAKSLTGKDKSISAIEINVDPQRDLGEVKAEVQAIVGDDFKVLDRFEQHSFLYRILRSEKMAVYLILSFVLLIAAFNLVASLSMLAIEKKKDITILNSMGLTKQGIESIFLSQGLLLSLGGATIGLLLGVFICLIQQYFGIIGLGGNSFVTDAYPVELKAADILLVFVTVLVIGWLASYIPAKNSMKSVNINELQTR